MAPMSYPDLTLADFGFERCPNCNGKGYDEHPGYYYGRAECGACQGLKHVRIDGEEITEDEWEGFLAYPGKVVG